MWEATRTMVMQMDVEVREFNELTSALWHERDILGLVLFKLAEQQLIVSAGQTRWLNDANDELDAALVQLRAAALRRAIDSDALAGQLGLIPGATLSELAQAAPDMWGQILLEHRESLLKLADEVAGATEANRQLLSAGARMVHDALSSITSSAGTYDAHGVATLAGERRPRLDAQA
jgi:FlgN protein